MLTFCRTFRPVAAAGDPLPTARTVSIEGHRGTYRTMSQTAVLVIGMMNTYQHLDAEHLIPNVERIIEPRGDRVHRARDADRADPAQPCADQGPAQRLLRVSGWRIYCAVWGTQRLILTGQATEQCILNTALDAYVRHFDVVVPTDAVAGIDPELGGCGADDDAAQHGHRADDGSRMPGAGRRRQLRSS